MTTSPSEFFEAIFGKGKVCPFFLQGLCYSEDGRRGPLLLDTEGTPPLGRGRNREGRKPSDRPCPGRRQGLL